MSLDSDSISDHIEAELENFRASRYRSEEQAVSLGAFAADDRATILALYEFLRALDARFAAEAETNDRDAILALAKQHALPQLVDGARALGRDGADEKTSAALHDIRGGALTALVVHLTRLGTKANVDELLRSIAIETHDQMKIMRNVLADIDPEGRAQDALEVPHTVRELARALAAFTANVDHRAVVASVEHEGDDATFAETCGECAAVDRVAYNLLNNAARYTSASVIDIHLTLVEQNLRVAVVNAVSSEHAATLRESLEKNPLSVFGSFTTTGSGQGLGIVSQLVARAYGVSSVERLAEKGYVGAKLIGEDFLGWFHWPLSPR